MSFKSKNLSVLTYANGFTLWHYTTPDPKADLFTPNYFQHSSDLLLLGDMILANVDMEGQPKAIILFVVTSNPEAGVIVSPVTQ